VHADDDRLPFAGGSWAALFWWNNGLIFHHSLGRFTLQRISKYRQAHHLNLLLAEYLAQEKD
jgi:hypothetical protein